MAGLQVSAEGLKKKSGENRVAVHDGNETRIIVHMYVSSLTMKDSKHLSGPLCRSVIQTLRGWDVASILSVHSNALQWFRTRRMMCPVVTTGEIQGSRTNYLSWHFSRTGGSTPRHTQEIPSTFSPNC